MSEELKIIAEQLGVTVEFIWPVLVRAQYTQALYLVIINVILFILMFVLWRVAKRRIESCEGGWDYLEDYVQILMVLGGLVCVVLGAVALVLMVKHGGDLLNPEYAALKDLGKFLS